MAISRFEELDFQETPNGELNLRRRREPTLDVDVYEVKLGEEYLMSSLFTVAEIALADLGLAAASGDKLRVVNGDWGSAIRRLQLSQIPASRRLKSSMLCRQ